MHDFGFGFSGSSSNSCLENPADFACPPHQNVRTKEDVDVDFMQCEDVCK
jgi:hypothetical protein